MNLNATILGQAIAFVLFVWFCMKYVWPPVMKAIEKRQQTVAENLASAERAREELAQARTDMNEQVENAKKEAQRVIEQASRQRAQILEEAKAEAERERARILAQAQAEIEDERRRARDELRKQVAGLAVAGAEKIIERSVDEAANNDIIDKLVAEL